MRPVAQHVHEVGDDVVEQALVVRDDDERAIGGAHRVDALRDDLQRVDVEAGVGLVEDRQPRLEHGHVEDLVALLLAAREAFVDRALQHAPRPPAAACAFSLMNAMKSIASSSSSPCCLRRALSAALRK